ncbi:unnamed protein product, partial [Ectocarpus sp. 13 AM-2016]
MGHQTLTPFSGVDPEMLPHSMMMAFCMAYWFFSKSTLTPTGITLPHPLASALMHPRNALAPVH